MMMGTKKHLLHFSLSLKNLRMTGPTLKARRSPVSEIAHLCLVHPSHTPRLRVFFRLCVFAGGKSAVNRFKKDQTAVDA